MLSPLANGGRACARLPSFDALRVTVLLFTAALLLMVMGCAGIPDSTLNSLAQAGGGCAKSTGMWGSILVMTAGTDKGTIRNGEVVVAGDCQGITIRDAATVRPVPAVKPIAP